MIYEKWNVMIFFVVLRLRIMIYISYVYWKVWCGFFVKNRLERGRWNIIVICFGVIEVRMKEVDRFVKRLENRRVSIWWLVSYGSEWYGGFENF